jgi:hypothetical protein
VCLQPKIKTEGGAAESTTAAPSKGKGVIEEEEVRMALLLAGKIKTQNLVNKFKTRLTDEVQKARFAKLVKKLGKIVEEGGSKYLVLKDEHKYNNVH